MTTSDGFWLQVKQGGEVVMEVGNAPYTAKERFWIVLRDPAIPNATVKHRTFSEAQAEAKRLCLKHNTPFYVFTVESEGNAKPQEPLWITAV